MVTPTPLTLLPDRVQVQVFLGLGLGKDDFADRKFQALFTPPRRPRLPQHPPPPAPPHPGRWRAAPRAAPARRRGLQPGGPRWRTVWTGTAAGGGADFKGDSTRSTG